jgi:integrase
VEREGPGSPTPANPLRQLDPHRVGEVPPYAASLPDALGVVRNLPACITGAAFDPVVIALVGDLQKDLEHGWIGLGDILALPEMTCGLRILALRWKDVDLERKVIRVTATLTYGGGEYAFTPPKTSRARRSIDLPAFVVAYLRRHREEQKVRSLGGSDVVFDNGVGEPLAPWTASADFRRIVRELELPRMRFHDLRHAHATQLLAAGVHPKAVSERLGHSSVAFTMDTYSAHIPSMGERRPTLPISCSG